MKLTPVEQQMYGALAAQPDGVTQETLAKCAPPPPKRDSNYVAVHMKNLRKKLAVHGLSVERIRGRGYKLVRTDTRNTIA